MTKLKTIATTCLAVSGLAMAQDNALGAHPGVSTSAASAPRTGLYTGVTKSNAAADNTVDIFSRRPTLIGDKQYFAGYGGEDMGNAAFSFKGMGWNWFGQVTGPTNAGADIPNTLRMGLGQGTAWGAGVLVAVDRLHTKTAAPNVETTTYYEASGFGVFGDFGLGGSDVYGQVGWNTGLPSVGGLQNSVLTKAPPLPQDDDQNHTLSLMAGWKKDATTEGTHAWSVEASYASEMIKTENPTVDATTNFFNIMPMWGYILRANTDYSVFVGANGLIGFTQPENGTSYTLSVSPNIAFQKQLGHGFEGFSGFAVTGSWTSSSDIPADGNEASRLLTGGADVAVGLRWVKDNFALEGSLKEAVLANGPYLIGGNAGQGLFVDIGIALGI